MPPRPPRALHAQLTATTFGLALLAPLGAARAQCPPSFAAPVSYSASGSAPLAVSVTDVNGDGTPDLVLLLGGSSAFTVRLGNGNGTFGTPTSYSTGASNSSPLGMAVGDLSGDGRADVAAANFTFNTVAIRAADSSGSGGFGAAITIPTGGAPRSVAIGDFNNDGRADLATGNNNSVSVLIGTGPLTYAASVNYGLASPAYAIIAVDVNGDGRLDLVTANGPAASVSVLLGAGNGTFANPTYYPVGTMPHSVAAGDVNGDGVLDLVTANRTSSNVSVLLGTGGGGFAAARNSPAGATPTSVAIGDIDGDGRPDLVVANDTADTVSVLIGTGVGSSGPLFSTPYSFTAPGDARAVAIGDFDADGHNDLAVATLNGNNGLVFLNTVSTPPVPVITQQPVGQVVTTGSSVTLTAAANFFTAAPSYRWRRNGVALTDGGPISGATSATLTINPVSASDEAVYDVQAISPACNGNQNVVTSAAAVLAVTGPSTPLNDTCASAQPLPAVGHLIFNTANATTDGPEEPNLGFGADPQIHKDVWFTYTATCTGVAYFSLCLSSFDTKMAVYAGTVCPGGSGSAIAGNDDTDCSFFGGTKSEVRFPVIAGHQYLIRVGGKNGAAGDAGLIFSCDGSSCLSADLGAQGGIAGRDGHLDNNDFIAFINAFFNQTECP